MKLKLLFIALLMIQFGFSQSKNETTSEKWIESNKEQLEIQDGHTFKMLFNFKNPAGETLRYYQMLNNVQVFDASIAISLNQKGEVTYHASTYDKTVENINTMPNITEDDAFETAKIALDIKSKITLKESQLYIYNKLDETKLVYRILTMSELKNGAWETIVDAHTGNVLSTKDVAIYDRHPKKETETEPKKETAKKVKKKDAVFLGSVNGTGMIFDTDPLTVTTSNYGGVYADNNDMTNSSFDAARSSVVLLDIDQTGSTYSLQGPYTQIANLTNPNTGLFSQSSPDFNFNRQEQGFEAVNCYYHIDKQMRYINNTLGITLAPNQNGGVIRYDPHGANGADNSYYTSGTLTFGEGGVDDAEDADVILHELGHGLHDWVTNGGLSQVNGLSEGSGDYWANSYKQSLGLWPASHPARYYIFGWDGHNPFWPGRRANVTNTYPSGLGGGIHADGQIWASAMMQVWQIVGKEKTDKAFLIGLGMTNMNTNQNQAAEAVRQAAINLNYTCDEIAAFTNNFTARGYSLSTYNCDHVGVDDAVFKNIVLSPNPANSTIGLSNITKSYQVEIHNILGQLMLTKTVDPSNNSINISNLTNGVYFLKFENQTTGLKFIKL